MAAGHARYIKNNPDYSYGDALETCNSDALTRCCKSVGIGLQTWNKDYQIEFIQHYGVRVQSTKDSKWYWRRKDRPPIPYERQSDRQTGPDYERKQDFYDDAKAHWSDMTSKRPDDVRADRAAKEEGLGTPAIPWEEMSDDQRQAAEDAAFAEDGMEE